MFNTSNLIFTQYDYHLAVENIGIKNQVLSGDTYEDIFTDDLALQRAGYENWKSLRISDRVNLSVIPIPWLDVMDKVTYQLPDQQLKYNINANNVIRHYDVTGKICPAPFVNDKNQWNNFKTRLTSVAEKPKVDDEVVTETYIKINGKNIKVNRILKDGKNYIELRSFENAGFEVGYDANSKIPILHNVIKELEMKVDDTNTSMEAVNIDGFNYVSLRSIANALGIKVDLEGKKPVLKTK